MRPDILIVDDDPGTIRLLGPIVSPEGSVRLATNGMDALRLARARPPGTANRRPLDEVLTRAQVSVVPAIEAQAIEPVPLARVLTSP